MLPGPLLTFLVNQIELRSTLVLKGYLLKIKLPPNITLEPVVKTNDLCIADVDCQDAPLFFYCFYYSAYVVRRLEHA